MNHGKVFLVIAIIAAVACCLPLSGYAGSAQASSDDSESCGWVCKNLKQDWNYVFHPDRVNQCVPRPLKLDKKMEELTKKAFTSDDPFISHYCGSPFSSTE